jgi:hypothetical protein
VVEAIRAFRRRSFDRAAIAAGARRFATSRFRAEAGGFLASRWDAFRAGLGRPTAPLEVA